MMSPQRQGPRVAEFEITTLEAVALGGVRRVLPFATRQTELPKLFQEVIGLYNAAGRIVAAPEIAIYRMVSETEIEATIGVDMPVLLEGFTRFELPETRALRTRHIGPFSGLAAVYPKLFAEVERRGLTATGTSREVYRLIAKDDALNVCDVYTHIA